MKLSELLEARRKVPLSVKFTSPDGEVVLTVDFEDRYEREAQLWIKRKPEDDADHAKRFLFNLHANPAELKHANRVAEIPPDVQDFDLGPAHLAWVNKQLEPYDLSLQDAGVDDYEVVKDGIVSYLTFPSDD